MDTFETAHKLIAISKNGKTVTSKGGGGYSGNAFGSIAIEAGGKNKYEWKLTCKQRRGGSMFIGIQSNRNVDAEWDAIDYGYDGWSGRKYNLGKVEEYGIKWGAGDVIEMRVDFEKREMGYSVNGSDQGIAFRNLRLGKTYYLVVSMQTGYEGSLFLSDFGIHQNKEEEKETDLKESEIAKLKEKINKLEKEKAGITNKYERILNEASNNQQNQKKQSDDENNALKQEITDLTAENKAFQRKMKNIEGGENALKQRINAMRKESETGKQELRKQKKQIKHLQQELNDKNAAMNQELNGLKQEINNLLDDKKEMELEINELREENQRLNGNNLDYALWREWDSKKVFYFIMNTANDGSLKPYQESIKKEIFESEYTGKDLAEIEFYHIQSMGIKKISARNAVYKAIQKLIQNKPQMDEGIASNEPTPYL